MIKKMSKLTHSEVADILHNMSAADLWQLNEGVAPIVFDYSKDEIRRVQKIYAYLYKTTSILIISLTNYEIYYDKIYFITVIRFFSL